MVYTKSDIDFSHPNQEQIIFFLLDYQMNGNHSKQVLCAHHTTQDCKIFKSVVNGEIKSETYVAADDNNTYLKTKHIIMLRQRDQLAKKNTMFNPQVECERVEDQKDSPDCQRYMRLQTDFKSPTNILDILTLQKCKSKSNFDVSSAAKIIDHVMRKLILTLMTSSNYQLYLWHDISIVIEQNQDIEIQINKSAMTGMNLLLFGDEIPFSEFTRIYEVVSLNELKQDQKIVILCYEMKIRAIAKILLTLLLQRYFDIMQEIPDYKTKVTSKQLSKKQGCLGILQKRKDFFKTFLFNPTLISRIQEYQRHNKVQYLSFLREVFLQEKVPTWSQVINKTIAKSKTPQLYQIKNEFNIQILIKRLKHTLIDKKGNNHISFFRNLGLYKDQHALLLALMHLKTSAAIQAISYPNINTFLATSRCNDNMFNDELFRFMLRAQQGIIELNLPIDNEPIPHMQKHNDKIRKFQVFEGLSTSKQLLSHDLKQSCPIQLKQMNCLEGQDQDNADYPLQTHNFLTALSSNLGQFTLKLRKNKFISEDYYSQGIRKYQHIFE